jgi:hypothetical protein
MRGQRPPRITRNDWETALAIAVLIIGALAVFTAAAAATACLTGTITGCQP